MSKEIQHKQGEEAMNSNVQPLSPADQPADGRPRPAESGLQHVPGILPAPWSIPDAAGGFGTGLPRSAHIPGTLPGISGAGHALSLQVGVSLSSS